MLPTTVLLESVMEPPLPVHQALSLWALMRMWLSLQRSSIAARPKKKPHTDCWTWRWNLWAVMIQGSLPQKQQEQADRQRKKDLDGVAGVDGSILCKLKILNPSLFQAILHFLKEQMFARKWKKNWLLLSKYNTSLYGPSYMLSWWIKGEVYKCSL